MAISGVALLAICTLLGVYLGGRLGVWLGVDANIGGVGIAMILLLSARQWLNGLGRLSPELQLGVGFWGALYIPIIVAMAAQQDVVGAVKGGPLVLVAAFGTVALCLAVVAIIGRLSSSSETMDSIAQRAASHANRAAEAAERRRA
jgi:malonate transporter MadL subunit